MRTAEEIMLKHLNGTYDKTKYPNGYPYIIEAMKEYAKEAIEECANRAKVKFPYMEKSEVYLPYGNEVDKQSILSLISELK